MEVDALIAAFQEKVTSKAKEKAGQTSKDPRTTSKVTKAKVIRTSVTETSKEKENQTSKDPKETTKAKAKEKGTSVQEKAKDKSSAQTCHKDKLFRTRQ